MRRSSVRPGVVAALAFGLLSFSVAAPAVDGVVEINQARALAGGVTPGDAPGFPVTISAPGSYRLTGNLATGAHAVTAIQIEADYVTVDLNGFTIACSFEQPLPTPCTDPGTGHGVYGETRAGLTVTNGMVRDMGGRGVWLGQFSEVSRVKARNNRETGIQVGISSRVDSCVAQVNGFNGIQTGAYSTSTNNIATENQATGIQADVGSVIRGNSVTLNQIHGIAASSSVISGNSAHHNFVDGISASGGSTVIGNQAAENGGYGLNLTGESGYAQNVMRDNNELGDQNDEVNVGAVDLGGNTCHAMACP
ncbi:MAG: right-handed parallel beta-helix repeat-containing protein [Chromatiales bacterium]|nr:right-handed parallel beta-helix repeat-containing protein [Chromatiales bacterium]